MRYNLGTGVLTWQAGERVSDRYGSVWLMVDGQNSLSNPASSDMTSQVFQILAEQITGKYGKLLVKVIEARDSTHIGDLFRQIFPITPAPGDIIELGIGTFFVEEHRHVTGALVGVKPDDGRKSDWMNPRALYRAHEQTVELLFETISRKPKAAMPPADLKREEDF